MGTCTIVVHVCSVMTFSKSDMYMQIEIITQNQQNVHQNMDIDILINQLRM